MALWSSKIEKLKSLEDLPKRKTYGAENTRFVELRETQKKGGRPYIL